MWLIQDIVNKFWQHTIKAFFNQWITTNVHTYTHTTDKYSHESLSQLIKSRTKLATEQFYEQTYKMHKEQKTMRETTQMLIYSVEHNLVGYMV